MAIETLRPNGAGFQTNISTVIGAATHWQAVDEVSQDGSTTYLSNDSGNQGTLQRDLYTIPDHSVGGGPINQVEVVAFTQHTVSFVHLSLRTHSTTYDSPDDVGAGGWSKESYVWTTNPFTSSAWTWIEIDALEIGIELSGSGGGGGISDCTQVYVEVTYAFSGPSVTTHDVIEVRETTGTGLGTITSIGNALITQHGHVWDTSANPDTGDSKTTKGARGLGSFASDITGLSAGTTYHTRAYATNANGTAYGADIEFATAATSAPTVTTEAVTSLTQTTATGNGTILNIGGSSVTQHGHVWATTINPDTTDSKTQNGFGVVGAFTSAITGLTEGTTYYVRAYATNGQGTAYGNNIILVTPVSPDVSSEVAGPIRIYRTRLEYKDAYGQQRGAELPIITA